MSKDQKSQADQQFDTVVDTEKTLTGRRKRRTKKTDTPAAELAAEKNIRTVKPVEKVVTCEFDELTVEGETAKHKYTCSFSDPFDIRTLVETKKFTPLRKFQLNLDALDIKNQEKIDKLFSLDAVRTKLVPYNVQMQLALQVINDMNGNAILADEVGLGKTIEAGLIMKEFLLREEINSILIISPKSLLSQWKAEMAEKFGEAFLIANNRREPCRS